MEEILPIAVEENFKGVMIHLVSMPGAFARGLYRFAVHQWGEDKICNSYKLKI